jgi:hypothetical protein
MRRRTRRLAVVLAVLALVVVAARLALDPLATWRTRRALEGIEDMRGTFADVQVRVRDLSYSITDLRLEKAGAGGARLPFFRVDRARFGLQWRELVRGHVVARVDLDAPRLNVVQREKPQGETPEDVQQVEEAPKIGRGLERLAPFLVNRAQVRDGEILFIDASEPEKPRLGIHSIELTLENFASRPALSKGEPTVLAARGVLQRSGKVSAFATADPLAKALTFAGQAKLEGLQIAELQSLVGAKSGIEPDQGVLDLAVRFRAEDGRITGGVRPVLKDGGTRPADPGLGARLKSFLADAALEIFSDDAPGRDAVATTIPIVGSVTNPDAQAMPTIIGILRNAFVQGLTSSLQGLPPPKAKEREGVLQQARRGLSRGKQPRAQPVPGDP